MHDYEQARKDIMDGIHDMGVKAGKAVLRTYPGRVIHGALHEVRDANAEMKRFGGPELITTDDQPIGVLTFEGLDQAVREGIISEDEAVVIYRNTVLPMGNFDGAKHPRHTPFSGDDGSLRPYASDLAADRHNPSTWSDG